MAVTQQIQVAEEDYLGAIRLNLRPRKSLRIVGTVLLALIALVVCAALGMAAAGGQMSNRTWGGLFILVYVPLWYFVIVPFQASRTYKASPLLARPTAVEISEECVRFNNGDGEARVPWEDFIRWKANKRLLLLYTAPSAYAILPLDFFTEDECEQVLAIAEAKLGPERT